jgi:hypothetical protein
VGSVEYIQPGECSRAHRGELRNSRSFASSPHELCGAAADYPTTTTIGQPKESQAASSKVGQVHA